MNAHREIEPPLFFCASLMAAKETGCSITAFAFPLVVLVVPWCRYCCSPVCSVYAAPTGRQYLNSAGAPRHISAFRDVGVGQRCWSTRGLGLGQPEEFQGQTKRGLELPRFTTRRCPPLWESPASANSTQVVLRHQRRV